MLPLRPRFASSLLLALVSTGCAMSAGPGAPSSPTDASPTDASSPPADAPSPTCPPRASFPLPAACGALPELALAANAVAGSPDTFAHSALRPTQNTHRPGCAAEPWQDGADARVRFAAPRAGVWRFTASGDGLLSLDAERDCATSLACTGQPDVHGPHASTTLTLDVPVQRGETLALTLDGCPAGAVCPYTLRAQWIGALSCDFLGDARQVCADARLQCALDPCDPERFRCLDASVARATMTSGRILYDAAEPRAYLVGRARVPNGAASIARTGSTVLGRWVPGAASPPSFGATVSFGPVVDGSAEFVGVYTRVPAGVTRGVMWLYDDLPVEGHPGIDAPVEPWDPPAAGDACDPSSFLTRCAVGLRCVIEGARGTCRAPAAVEVTGLRAWRDAPHRSLTLEVNGYGLGQHVQRYDVTVLDRGGAALARLADVVAATTVEPPSNVPFRTTFDLAAQFVPDGAGGSARFRVPMGAARVRVVARDQSGAESAPVDAAVTDVAVTPLGGSCVAVSTGCAEGLTCERTTSGVARARCAPSEAPRRCYLQPGTPTWAPPARGGTYAVSGVAHAVGAVVRCYGGRTPRYTRLEFVAPTAGAYTFELRGLHAIELNAACSPGGTDTVCVVASPGAATASASVTLAAGQRVAVALLSAAEFTAPAAFTLSVQVP